VRSAAQEAPSRAGRYAGLAGAAVVLIAAGAFVIVRNANQRVNIATQEAKRAEKLAEQQTADRLAATEKQAAEKEADEEQSPVFLSVISEPEKAELTATWKEGEKKGQTPLSFDVPHNTKVHLEFSKAGFTDYSMDVIGDRAQTVHAVLNPTPVAAETHSGKKQQHGRKTGGGKKTEAPATKDGVIDVDDALK
jgi:hypothetical protein